jgi:hypothetical protein
MGRGRNGGGRAGLVVAAQRRDLGRFADGSRIGGFADGGGNRLFETTPAQRRRNAQRQQSEREAAQSRIADRELGFEYGNARYAKNKIAVKTAGVDGMASIAARVAQDVGGRWSSRERAFVMSVGAFARFTAGLERERNSIMALANVNR